MSGEIMPMVDLADRDLVQLLCFPSDIQGGT